MPSNHLILCFPLLVLSSMFLSFKVFSNESVLHIRWPKFWSFSFSITSWQIDGQTMETYFGGFQNHVDGDCSHEIKRCLLLGRKVITNLDSILKSRDVTLPTKAHLVKAMVFPGVMYGCESWTVKKAERQRIDAFELWCWRRLLESPLDCKEIQPVHSEGDQPWDFFGRNDAKAETPVLLPPHVKS